MGCDIHCLVQVKAPEGWRTLKQGYGDRCYDVFAVLANVRNGYGFAGVVTGSPIVPISLPRGLPRDVKVDRDGYVKVPFRPKYSDDQRYWLGDHSHSWVSLTEALNYPWDTRRKKYGWVQERVYKAWDPAERAKGHSPSEWCGGLSGARMVQEKEYLAGSRGDPAMVDRELYIFCEWQQSLAQSCRGFMDWLEEAKALADSVGGVDKVRLVFGFDS